ncbi:Uncharacterized protein CK203_082308 [Vitis vinifera]|nr:Uncharacterized protein CK203_082308 [Vitis vinifera]
MWRSNKWARTRVWILSLLFWLLTVFLDRHVERVSRRMCNLAYVTLVLAQNLQVIGGRSGAGCRMVGLSISVQKRRQMV